GSAWNVRRSTPSLRRPSLPRLSPSAPSFLTSLPRRSSAPSWRPSRGPGRRAAKETRVTAPRVADTGEVYPEEADALRQARRQALPPARQLRQPLHHPGCLLRTGSLPRSLGGLPIAVSGFVYRTPAFARDEMAVVRLGIACHLADVLPS